MRAWLLVLPLLAGCSFHSTKYLQYPANPYTQVTTIAVAPFLSEGKGDGMLAAEVFATELAQVPGIRVIRPSHVKEAVLKDSARIANVQEALGAAKRLGADAIIVGCVTEYDPYPPPIAGMAIQMFAESAMPPANGGDPTAEVLAGRPLEVTPAEQRYLVIAFERVFDAHQAATREELKQYAEAFTPQDRGFQGEGYFLGVYERYLHFCANVMIRQVMRVPGPYFPGAKKETEGKH